MSPHVSVQVVPPAVTLLAQTASIWPDGFVQFVHVPPQTVQLGERLAAHRAIILHPATDLGARGLVGRCPRQAPEVGNEGDRCHLRSFWGTLLKDLNATSYTYQRWKDLSVLLKSIE